MTGTSGDIGFFNENKSVSNVTFDNFQVSATGGTNVGIVFGQATGSTYYATITNVTVKNSSVIGGRQTGAIAGKAYGANISNCKVENTIVNGQYKVGGIVGQVDQGNITSNSLSNVTIQGANIWPGKENDGFILGKIVGCWATNDSDCTNNTFTNGTTEATANIGEVNENYSAPQE